MRGVLELFWLFENCIGENLCRPGLEPGPIATGRRGYVKLVRQLFSIIDSGGYGSRLKAGTTRIVSVFIDIYHAP